MMSLHPRRKTPWPRRQARGAAPGRAGDAGPASLGLGVLAQHAEQPPHLRQPGPCRVPDLRQPLRPGGGHSGRGQAGGLRLDGDHRDVVRDHVVQLTGDPRPLAAGRVLHQRARDGLRRGGVQPGLGARTPGDPGPRRGRDQRREHDREHPGLGPRRSAGNERQDQERHGQAQLRHTAAAPPLIPPEASPPRQLPLRQIPLRQNR